MTDAGRIRQLGYSLFQSFQNPVGPFDVVAGNEIPDAADVLLSARGENKLLHPLKRLRSTLRCRILAKACGPSTNSPRSACSLPMAISFRSSVSRNLFSCSLSF